MKRHLLAIVLAVTACEGHDKQAPIEPPDIQIVSPGNAPRKLLRYHVPKGASQALDVAVDMTLNAGEMGGPLPTIVMSMLLGVEGVAPDGGMKLHTTIVEVTARDKPEAKIPASALAGPFEAMKGIAMTSTLAPNGRLSKAQLEGGKQLPPDIATQLSALTSSFETVVMPLPNEVVGVGAVWRSSRDISQNGLKLTSVNTFSINAIDGDTISYSIETSVHGPDQKITQAGTTVDIKDITGTGGGRGVIHLDKLEFTSDLAAELRTKMAGPGDSNPTAMKMITQMHVGPATPAPAPAVDAGSAGSGSAN